MNEQQGLCLNADLVKKELLTIYISNGDQPPPNIEQMVDIWAQDLKPVPAKHLSECFQRARRDNKRFRMVKSAHVLEAWDALRTRFSAKDWIPSGRGEQDNLYAFSYWTVDSLPLCYQSNRMRFLIQNQKILNDYDAMELLELRKKKFRPGQVRLNEDIQYQINAMEKPNEVVSLGDLPMDVRKMLALA